MQYLEKLLLILLAIGGIVLVFYVSWFWTLFLVPMVLILLWDVVGSWVRRKPKN